MHKIAIKDQVDVRGQKQIYAVQNNMSALPPIADICGALAHVRYRPIADITLLNTTHSFLDLPRPEPRASAIALPSHGKSFLRVCPSHALPKMLAPGWVFGGRPQQAMASSCLDSVRLGNAPFWAASRKTISI